ncbi:MAG: L-2-amino-thiazoline-4-carboxylic acid hydrolase [Lachnospiraceae bacterium]|nr:L-2-amino-thiazoline-4-carboxylic acid hydrolase [Lachnospiraceae bacterium]
MIFQLRYYNNSAFCKQYGYEEINPVLCNIDYITMSMMHSRLIREHTIAEGGGICDYRTVGNRVKDPQ